MAKPAQRRWQDYTGRTGEDRERKERPRSSHVPSAYSLWPPPLPKKVSKSLRRQHYFGAPGFV